jgi:catechol 2,3-dioxygenase-like lactoylglutathione lyase family enzyme
MTAPFESSRDIILRTEAWDAALQFYGKVLGLPQTMRTDTLAGFDAGAFRIYVEKGAPLGPVFEFLVPDVAAAKQGLLAAGCVVVEEDASVPRCYLRDPYGLVFNIGARP